MIARFSPDFAELAAACFPVPGCRVSGYTSARGTRYTLFIRPPQPFAGALVYGGQGRTCFEALSAAVRLFHDSAHAYPAARPLAEPGSYDGTPNPADPF